MEQKNEEKKEMTVLEVIHEAWCHPITGLEKVNSHYELASFVMGLSQATWFIMILATIGSINWIIGIKKGNVKVRNDKTKNWMIFNGKEWVDE